MTKVCGPLSLSRFEDALHAARSWNSPGKFYISPGVEPLCIGRGLADDLNEMAAGAVTVVGKSLLRGFVLDSNKIPDRQAASNMIKLLERALSEMPFRTPGELLLDTVALGTMTYPASGPAICRVAMRDLLADLTVAKSKLPA